MDGTGKEFGPLVSLRELSGIRMIMETPQFRVRDARRPVGPTHSILCSHNTVELSPFGTTNELNVIFHEESARSGIDLLRHTSFLAHSVAHVVDIVEPLSLYRVAQAHVVVRVGWVVCMHFKLILSDCATSTLKRGCP